MKSFLGRILLCVVPVVISAVVVGWAYDRYRHGQGGFRLGVDLVGGTILVYEVDPSKQLAEQSDQQYKADDLATALKRRIDPADLLNVTIRPVASNPPRVEIVLPTGGRQQRIAEEEAWHALLNDVEARWPAPEGDSYANIPPGSKDVLKLRATAAHPDASQDIIKFIDGHYQIAKGRRGLTGEEIETIKNLIGQQGRLEFRILANDRDDAEAIRRASEYVRNPDNADKMKLQALLGYAPPPPVAEGGGSSFPVTLSDGTLGDYTYSWVEVGKEELYSPSMRLNNAVVEKAHPEIVAARDKEALPFGHILIYSRTIPNPDRLSPKDREEGKKYEYFVLTRNPAPHQEVTGDYLTSASAGVGERGTWEVRFRFNSTGADLFGTLTKANKPSQDKFERQLAIILDGQVRSAPNLQSPIHESGRITGNFTKKDVDAIVTILRAGALPATLKQTPVSENMMGATLGEDTIRKGTLSVVLAFVAVLLFMLVYYRFAGVVACIALLANLLLTVAVMVLVNATFTLPGLAGLVLMLGMAVDANVLIYERLREERERGASLALAIRNGYDRAFPTIIDTHLSSIFTAIVLYVVGNDQLKGFGISLTVGLIISLFTSLFMTRTMFDYWMARGWLHKLSMGQLFRRPNIDFMGIRYYWFTATIVLTILGAGLFFYRAIPVLAPEGGSVLNIDFMGGTAYTGRLTEPMTIGELRKLIDRDVEVPGLTPEQNQLPGLSIVPEYTRGDTGDRASLVTVRTENKNREEVLKIISARMGPALQHIYLRSPKISEDNKTALLTFFRKVKEGDQEKEEEAYASRAQVTVLLSREGLRNFQVEPASNEHEGQFSKMRLVLTDPMNRADFEKLLAQTKEAYDNSPQPERLENFDAQLAAKAQEIAMYAILASWAAILLYLWFRFASWTFGAATVLCLIHDLFFTLGFIAAAHYLHGTTLGNLLMIGDFKIDQNTIAALLTLVGYSVSDTIVVFDRIREVRGKNPALTPTTINDSVNQTLSRTILSSLTVWLVVIVLYLFGGEGVHLFAFVMIVGVVVGTYSSIYIASPLLLIFREGTPSARDRARLAQQAAAAEA